MTILHCALVARRSFSSTTSHKRNGSPLLSLADELLYNTFEYAILGDLENGAINAYKLSRVCRRCRSQVLANPKLWTNIRHGPELRSMDFVAACLQRSSDLPLNVTATVVFSDHEPLVVATDDFMTYIREHAADRCRSLQIHYLPRTRPYRTPLFDEQDIWVGDGVFPELQILKINFPLLPIDIHRASYLWCRRFHGLEKPFPKLRELSLRNFVPYFMRGYDTMSRLDLTCTVQSAWHLQEFLTSCRVLQDLRLTLYMSSNSSIRSVMSVESMPILRNFTLVLLVDGYLEVDNALNPIFSIITFSDLRVFNIHITFLDKASWGKCWDEVVHFTVQDPPSELDFGQYLTEIIHEDKFPSLTSLHLSLSAAPHTYEKAKFSIPVQFLPSLQNLELHSDLLLVPDFVYVDENGVSGGSIGRARVNVELKGRVSREKEWLKQINGRKVA